MPALDLRTLRVLSFALVLGPVLGLVGCSVHALLGPAFPIEVDPKQEYLTQNPRAEMLPIRHLEND